MFMAQNFGGKRGQDDQDEELIFNICFLMFFLDGVWCKTSRKLQQDLCNIPQTLSFHLFMVWKSLHSKKRYVWHTPGVCSAGFLVEFSSKKIRHSEAPIRIWWCGWPHCWEISRVTSKLHWCLRGGSSSLVLLHRTGGGWRFFLVQSTPPKNERLDTQNDGLEDANYKQSYPSRRFQCRKGDQRCERGSQRSA